MGNFKINKWYHYKWFFDFIWSSLKDLTSPKECFKYGLIQENWGDFKTRLHIDGDPEIKKLEQDFIEWRDKNDKDN